MSADVRQGRAPFRALHLGFWEFLARTGTFPAEVILEHRDRLRGKWRPLTSLLVEAGLLERNQVAILLRRQLAEPSLRLGDLAVSEGLCARKDVDRMLEIQEERCPHPLDLLLEDERIGPEEAIGAVKSYVRHLEGRVETLERLLEGETPFKIGPD
jgi:hypothetical protein